MLTPTSSTTKAVIHRDFLNTVNNQVRHLIRFLILPSSQKAIRWTKSPDFLFNTRENSPPPRNGLFYHVNDLSFNATLLRKLATVSWDLSLLCGRKISGKPNSSEGLLTRLHSFPVPVMCQVFHMVLRENDKIFLVLLALLYRCEIHSSSQHCRERDRRTLELWHLHVYFQLRVISRIQPHVRNLPLRLLSGTSPSDVHCP